MSEVTKEIVIVGDGPTALTPEQQEANRRTQASRRAALTKIAQLAGYETWHKAETAVRNGEAVIARVKAEKTPKQGRRRASQTTHPASAE